MFTEGNWSVLFDGGLTNLGLGIADFAVLAVGILLICIVSHLGKDVSVREKLAKRPVAVCAVVCGLLLLIAIFGAYGVGYDSSQFIYNQF